MLMAAYMYYFRCKAYTFTHNILKLQKMSPKALIGYLMGYDLINIFSIWILSAGKVIRTRDVRFDDDSLYDPQDIELGALHMAEVQALYEEIKVPDEVYDRLKELDAESDYEDMLIDWTSRLGIAAQSITNNTPGNSTPSAPNEQLPTPRGTESPSPPHSTTYTPSESGEYNFLGKLDNADGTVSTQIDTLKGSTVSSNRSEMSANGRSSRASSRVPL